MTPVQATSHSRPRPSLPPRINLDLCQGRGLPRSRLSPLAALAPSGARGQTPPDSKEAPSQDSPSVEHQRSATDQPGGPPG